jgi:hypothetical protein
LTGWHPDGGKFSSDDGAGGKHDHVGDGDVDVASWLEVSSSNPAFVAVATLPSGRWCD